MAPWPMGRIQQAADELLGHSDIFAAIAADPVAWELISADGRRAWSYP